MEKDPQLMRRRWDTEYRLGKYEGDGPIPFVGNIVSTLEANNLRQGTGLYIGCGNGRNYIPLVDAGFDLTGLDISPEALQQIEKKRPFNLNPLVCADFLDYQPASAFDYLISIQVFQHGCRDEIEKYFAKVARLLKTGGLFFLRVNSTATQIYHHHKVVETCPEKGVTITYTDGPKAGLAIHFYTKDELDRLTKGFFEPISTPTEVVMDREPPQTGQWVQWEGIWRKAA